MGTKVIATPIIILISLLSYSAYAQNTSKSVTNLKTFFSKGKLSGEVKEYYMSTINESTLNDYCALALGGTIKYKTAEFKGCKIGLTGNMVYNILSTDLALTDSINGTHAVFERQLFDVTNPSNKHDLDRLEELYIQYAHKKVTGVVGKFLFDSPLVNPDHTRMKPHVFKGGKLKIDSIFGSKIVFGIITGASPRSTTHWYDLNELLGTYNQGIDVQGNPADYKGNVSTIGLSFMGLSKSFDKLNISLWNYHLDKISNTSVLRLKYKKTSSWQFDYYYQDFNVSQNVNYTRNNQSTHIFSTSFIYPIKHYSLKIAWTSILEGQFLFPRELGKESLLSFAPRSRMEGTGQSNALLMNVNLKQYMNIGHQFMFLPSVNDFELNKYQQSSYGQVYADIQYPFTGKLKGLKMRVLYLFRYALVPTTEEQLIANKVNFHQLNIISSINF